MAQHANEGLKMGFYEMLSVTPMGDRDEIRAGYHRQLGLLVRKLRKAREIGADTAALEARRDDLQEAYEILSDPGRRRVYDGFLALDGAEEQPTDLDSFWVRVRDSVADPAAAAAVELVRALTSLPVGDSLDAAPQTARPVEIRAASAPAPAPVVEPPPPAAPAPTIDLSAAPLPGPAASASIPNFGSTMDMGEPAVPASPEDPVLDVARLAETYGYDGRYLQSVRQLRGITLDEVADDTKIALRYLEAIEINDYARLPAAVFVRGYLREIADVLEVDDPDALVAGYMSRYAQYRGD